MTNDERAAKLRQEYVALNAAYSEEPPLVAFLRNNFETVLNLLDEAHDNNIQWQEIALMVQEELTTAGQRGHETPPMNFNDAIRKIRIERDEARAERDRKDGLLNQALQTIDEMHAETARLQAPPGASALEIAKHSVGLLPAIYAQFGPSHDGAVERDLIAAIARIVEQTTFTASRNREQELQEHGFCRVCHVYHRVGECEAVKLAEMRGLVAAAQLVDERAKATDLNQSAARALRDAALAIFALTREDKT